MKYGNTYFCAYSEQYKGLETMLLLIEQGFVRF